MKTAIFLLLVWPFGAVGVAVGFVFQALAGGFDIGRELVSRLADPGRVKTSRLAFPIVQKGRQ